MRVLIVDDDPMIRKALQTFIEGQLHHEVTQSDNGLDALEIFKQRVGGAVEDIMRNEAREACHGCQLPERRSASGHRSLSRLSLFTDTALPLSGAVALRAVRAIRMFG